MANDADELELEIERELDETREDFRKRLVEISVDALGGVIRRTPVDTGFARNSWRVELGDNPSDQEPDGIPSFDVTERATQSIERAELGDVISIFNNVRYIRQLEEGRSDQAPNGMVSVTLAELRSRFGRQT